MKKLFVILLCISMMLTASSCEIIKTKPKSQTTEKTSGTTSVPTSEEIKPVPGTSEPMPGTTELTPSTTEPTSSTTESTPSTNPSQNNDVTNGTDGLDFYPLPDGTYGVKVGKTIYLEEITIPATYNGKAVTQILNSAFVGCSSLENITIPDSVTSIGTSAFSGCSSLVSIKIPDRVTAIRDYVFQNCSNLESITIPYEVSDIGYGAFIGCGDLQTVYYGGASEDWAKIIMGEEGNSKLTSATRYYYSETQPANKGNFWHYVGGVPTKWG